MKKVDIEQIPYLLKAGEITEKEAEDAIWIEAYTHPHKYHLQGLNEDDRSDFLISMHDSFVSLCRKYEAGRIPFSMFLKGVFFHYKFAFMKRRTLKQEEEREFKVYMKTDLDDPPLLDETSDPAENNPLIHPPRVLQEQRRLSAKRRLITETSLLILAMRYCHDLDDTLLSHISTYTRIPQCKLEELIHRMKKQSEERRKKFDKIRRKRDTSYFLHARYAMKMKQDVPYGETKEQIKKKYEVQTRLWKKHNEELSSRCISSPTNKEISKELGINPRTVSFYINHFMSHKPVLKEMEHDADTEKSRSE